MTAIERIKAGLESDTPGRVEWRSLLETALFEIERLRDDLAASERLRDHATKELGKDSALVERLRAALKPFADCVYNDFGSVTYLGHALRASDYYRAYCVVHNREQNGPKND